MSEPTVYIVDDDPDMRDSLRWLMTTVGLAVATFDSAGHFLHDFAPNGPGCLVFDIRMPGTSGLDLFEELTRRGDCMPVIFITAHADVPMAIRALKSGAVEFVEKPFHRQALLEKVQRAIRDDVARRAWLADRELIRDRFRALTDKEREVLGLIMDGRPNKAIASVLEITSRAVEMRRASLMKKLGARSLVEMMRMALAIEDTAGRSQGLPRWIGFEADIVIKIVDGLLKDRARLDPSDREIRSPVLDGTLDVFTG